MKKINYSDRLKAERIRLQLEIAEREEIMRQDLEWVREELEPINKAARIAGNVFSRKDNGIINNGLEKGIDLLVKNLVLSNASWPVKWVVSYLAKNISSNLVAGKKQDIIAVLRKFVHRVREKTHADDHTNGQMHHVNDY